MTNQIEPIREDPAAALESDLAAIRALLQQAVALSNNENKGSETRLAAMTAATRLFSAAAKGSEMIARLKGHVHQTRHTTVVQHDEPPMRRKGQDHDAWWASLTPRQQAEVERRVNAVVEKFTPLVLAERAEERAEREREMREGRGDPSEENPKTTSRAFDAAEPDDPGDLEDGDEFDDAEQT